MRDHNSFLQFHNKLMLFWEQLFNLKIFHLSFEIKNVTLIFYIKYTLLQNAHVSQKIFS